MDLGAILTDTVTLQSQTGQSAYGDPTWGSQRTITARVQTVLRRVATEKGVTVNNASVLITDQAILEGDRVWLPGADTSNPDKAQRLADVTTASAWWDGTTLYQADLR